MESKNVKVIDEHGIDREASILCKIDVDGSDYVIYSIERDGENDNLFVSKLIKNNDGTSNMINIEDDMEKSKLADVVKELIKHSIDTSEDKTNGVVTLSNGKNVNISSVLFNKEQNINVGKTYISTVKKSVTKVGENFYRVENTMSSPEPTAPVVEAVMPELNSESETPMVEPVAPVQTVQDVMDSFVSEPVVPEVKGEELASAVPPVEPSVVVPVAPVVPEVAPVVEPIVPEVKAPEIPSVPVTEPVPVTPVVETSKVEVQPPANFGMPEPSQQEVKPVQPEISAVEPSVVASTVPVPPVSAPVVSTPELVLDGSKETNLNVALGEVSSESNIPVSDVETIREFGQDEPVNQNVDLAQQASVAEAPVKRSFGFANNKFLIVVAILFFVSACVFLGYEVWQYFKLVK